MKKYHIYVYNSAVYENIKAESEEEAREIARKWWNEHAPCMIVNEDKE